MIPPHQAPPGSHATDGRARARTGLGRELDAPVRPARLDPRALTQSGSYLSRGGAWRAVAVQRHPLSSMAASLVATGTCRPPSFERRPKPAEGATLCVRARVPGRGHKCRQRPAQASVVGWSRLISGGSSIFSAHSTKGSNQTMTKRYLISVEPIEPSGVVLTIAELPGLVITA
jgi:hypothetical protein